MPLPDFELNGSLPPGIHCASLAEVLKRFGTGSDERERYAGLLVSVVEAAVFYANIKRVLLWGSYVTSKAIPNDLDYSVVVSVDFDSAFVRKQDERFLIPHVVRQMYGSDPGYLIIRDYPLENYVERLDFVCHRKLSPVGIVEISLRGEVGESHDN